MIFYEGGGGKKSRKSWAVKADVQPWLGHTDIDLTVKTGAGELWCHDSVLSLPLSLKEDGEQLKEGERKRAQMGKGGRAAWKRGGVEVSEWETENDRSG